MLKGPKCLDLEGDVYFSLGPKCPKGAEDTGVG